MEVAVLCPGPSLQAYLDKRQRYDLVIGVNRAAQFETCDYWAFLDHYTFQMIDKPLAKPTILTPYGSLHQLLQPEVIERSRWYDYNPVVVAVCHKDYRGLGVRRYSAFTAVVCAMLLGGLQIHCYGMTWSGDKDVDGFSSTAMVRNEKRWTKEAEMFEKLVKHLQEEAKVEVIRHD